MPNSVVEDFTFDNMNQLDVMRHYLSDSNNANLSDNALRDMFDYSYRADGKRTALYETFGGTGSGPTPLNPTLTNNYTWSYDNAGRLLSEILDSSDNSIDQTESYIMDLVGNRMRKEVNKPATAYVDQVFAYNYDANDRITSETLDNGVNGAGVDQTTTYGWTQTQQTSKTVSVPSVSSVVQSMSYGLGGQLERVVTTTSNGSGTVTGRTRVDYRYTPQGIRTISVDWNDANLDGTFAAGERTGSIEYLIDNANFTGYQQTILETVKNAAGQATKRTSYTFGVDEITQTTTLPLPGGGEGWGEGETLTFAHDGKGSVRALFGAAAAIAQVFTYSAYGELLAIHNGSGTLQPLTSSLTSVLYNGEGLDARTGLYNMRARWYSASNARWERLDPFAGNPNDPFSFNKYGFVHGDPVQGIDPTGYEFSLSGMSTAISIGLGKVAGVVSLIGSVFTAVNTVLTVFDVIQSLYDIASNGNLSQTIKKEVTEYFTQLRANANDPEIGVLFNGDFWKGSAESFSRNLDELSRQLLASRTITSDLLNALRKIRDSKYPRIVIQLPVPPTLPVPKALVPLPIKVRLGPIQVGVTLQFGASKKHKGRVLGIAVQTADNESAITQVFRQDYHEWHVQSGPSEDTRWNDNTGKFKFHYHVPK